MLPDAGTEINFRDETGTVVTGTVISQSSIRWTEQTDEGAQDRVDHRAVVELPSGLKKEINESTEWTLAEQE